MGYTNADPDLKWWQAALIGLALVVGIAAIGGGAAVVVERFAYEVSHR